MLPATSAPSAIELIVETLENILSADRATQMLDEAREHARLSHLPETPVSLRIFVEGALLQTLRRHMPLEHALEITDQLQAALELPLRLRGSHVSRSNVSPPRSDIRRRPTLPAHPHRVLVASQASVVVFLIQDMLGENVEVLPVSSENDLRDRIRRCGGLPLLLVVDRHHPALEPTVARTLRNELDPRSAVVWWTDSNEEQLSVEASLAGGPELVRTTPDIQLADLGELCRELVELR